MQTGNNSKTYHRYCTGCGWGYSKGAWQQATFCTKCGIPLPNNNPEPRKARAQNPQRYHNAANRRQHAARRNRPDVEVLPPERSKTNRGRALVAKSMTMTKEHPLASATGTALAGGGMMIAGQAISALGAGMATAGLVVCGLSTVTLVVGAAGKEQSVSVLGFKGIGAGICLSAAGAVVGIAGQAISIGGAIALGGSGCLAGYGLVKTLDENKHKRVHAVAVSRKPKFLTA